MTTTTETTDKPGGKLPPRFVIRGAWVLHRAMYRFSGGRFGLRPASEKTWGMMRIKRSGERVAASGSPSWATTRTARTWSPWP